MNVFDVELPDHIPTIRQVYSGRTIVVISEDESVFVFHIGLNRTMEYDSLEEYKDDIFKFPTAKTRDEEFDEMYYTDEEISEAIKNEYPNTKKVLIGDM